MQVDECRSCPYGGDQPAAGISVAGLAAPIIDSPRQRECRCTPAMRITSETVADGIREQLFTVGDVPGVLWTPRRGLPSTKP
jgi:hypothetical protein